MPEKETEVTVTLPWSQARALMYASQWGIDHGKWPSDEYREQAREARSTLVRAEGREILETKRTLSVLSHGDAPSAKGVPGEKNFPARGNG